MRFRRQNLAWLALLTVLVGLVTVTGFASGTPQAAAVLIGLYLVALAASLIEFQPRRLRISMPQSPLVTRRMSAQAREASERARRRGDFLPGGLTLVDIGLISLHTSSEGMVMRRSRTVSLDDDGVRPYISLNVQSSEADRHALIRYEIVDQAGRTQYVHEMKTYLRDGEMNILADHLLPLAGNERLIGTGEWDLRVLVDGQLLGLLSFTTTPSVRARDQQIRQAADAAYRLQDEIEDESVVTLEDLLRSEDRQPPARDARRK